MTRRFRFACAVMAAVGSVAAGDSARAMPSTEQINKCTKEVSTISFPALISSIEELIRSCGRSADRAKSSNDCAAAALAELRSNEATGLHAGKVRQASEKFIAQIAAACAGADGVPYTDDDVEPISLDPGPRSGFRFRPWGAELAGRLEPTLFTQVGDQASSIVHMQTIVEEDCIAKEPVEVWMRKPGLQRLIETYQCLAINEVLVNGDGRVGTLRSAIQVVKFEITSPPVTYDAGVDRLPIDAPDGVNDGISIPAGSGCPLPGVGLCKGDTNTVCSMAPGAGRDAANADCDRANPCVEGLVGPDGVTAGDVPRMQLGDGRFFYKLTDGRPHRPGPKVEYACLVEGMKDGSGAPVTTTFAGTCEGGPHADRSCSSDVDCDTALPPRYFCLSGDEYFCHVNEVLGSNRDNVPPCGKPCLAAEIFGVPGAGCGTGGEAFCVLGSCDGGIRNGQACDEAGTLTCPGGSCAGLGDELKVTGDEAGFFAPKLAGMTYLLCPFQFRHDAPFELLNGVGWASSDVTDAPLFSCRPTGVSAHLLNAYVHEPSGDGRNDVALVGLFTSSHTAAGGEIPCPEVSVPFPAAGTGLPVRTGIGPIVGVGGAIMP